MNKNNENVEVIELDSSELPRKGQIEYLAKNFMYTKNGTKKNGIKFIIYDDLVWGKKKEFVLMWNKQLRTTNLKKYLFDEDGNKIKSGIETYLLYEEGDTIDFSKVVLMLRPMLNSSFNFMYDQYGEKRWGRTKFAVVSETGRFNKFLTLLLDPEDEYPLWMRDPEEIRKKCNALATTLEKLEPKDEEKDDEEETGMNFFHAILLLNLLTGIIITFSAVNTSSSDLKNNNDYVLEKTVRIPGEKNEKYNIKKFEKKMHELKKAIEQEKLTETVPKNKKKTDEIVKISHPISI